MYNIKDLKNTIEVTESTIVCPVLNCKKEVRRIRKGEKLNNVAFLCPEHGIYISPSTFEYVDESSNLVSQNQVDKALLLKIKNAKRECRISRERSEDALSWNIFRHLENRDYLKLYIKKTLGIDIKSPELILWSFSEKESTHSKGVLNELSQARKHFGEDENRSTEPDIIIKGENAIIFIEAKFTSGNNTSGNEIKKSFRIINSKKYNAEWFKSVFKLSYESLIRSGKYELMRLWLLGTWIAHENQVKFYLINLTREKFEQAIEPEFKQLIIENKSNTFKRLTWESIYDFILSQNNDIDKDILEYFENKTCGFNGSRKKQKAFNRSSSIST